MNLVGPDQDVRVAHYLAGFPTLSETFVLPLLVRPRRSRPFVLTQRVGEGIPEGLVVEAIKGPSKSRLAGVLSARIRGFELREELSFWKALRAHADVDLVHAHFGPQGYAAARACAKLGIPLVCTFYGYDLKLDRDPRWRRRYRTLWSIAAAFAVEGPHMAKTLVKMGAPEDRVVLQPLPVPIDQIPFAARNRGSHEPLLLVQVARMVEKKGIDLSLRAVARLRGRGVNVRLEIVGDGPLNDSLRRLASELAIGDVVHFHGPLSHALSLAALSRAHLLVQPSRTARDGDTEGGAPYTILEAQASGLLVVASRHADIPNIVAPEGFFGCDENDVDGLAAAIDEARGLASDWSRRAGIVRRFVEEHHSADAVVGRMEQLYLRLARRRLVMAEAKTSSS